MNGNHAHGNWEFFYKVWKADDNNDIFQVGATPTDMLLDFDVGA